MFADDGSVYSDFALEQLVARPWIHATEFICLRAVPTMVEHFCDSPDFLVGEDVLRSHRQLLERAKSVLAKSSKRIASQLPHCTVSTQLVHGDPRDVIVEVTKNHQIDLVVMGHQGKNLAQRVMIGSVSEAVAVWSRCSVEISKQRVPTTDAVESNAAVNA
jgi:nucleotide-binding universal stress UspA family protein